MTNDMSDIIRSYITVRTSVNTVRSESRCALRLRYVDSVVSIEAAVEVCCSTNVFSF
jgi:hypothetical protein